VLTTTIRPPQKITGFGGDTVVSKIYLIIRQISSFQLNPW